MKTSDFDYYLPSELIAQTPIEPRDSSRLMLLNRADGSIQHKAFHDITQFLRRGDVLVMNNSRVIPARLFGKKVGTGASVEILLLRRLAANQTWQALVKPGKCLPAGSVVVLDNSDGPPVTAEIQSILDDGIRQVVFSEERPLNALGNIPLPPYIHAPLGDKERYQTVYANAPGSVAAPTAGLHFTAILLDELRAMGIEILETTLHIGLDTFRPVTVDDPTQHRIHSEYGIVTKYVAERVSLAKSEQRRVVCVGTTSVRLLEYAAGRSISAPLEPFSGWVDLLILPGYRFRLTDIMQTNFHLPKSTLLMMVSAFAGAELIKRAYAEAVAHKYRFYSFGDATLII
ncbi:MAG: tRNA preQ1(34) S-adenosylmethionine ribosyltransferase-isomerase QueA [Dehalococcoidia bacterium]|nr:tRNA preQ1(34) S-adenosylmethionine ribosyltransferase-isomerase QueA [Dehalococcoidia bacterium]